MKQKHGDPTEVFTTQEPDLCNLVPKDDNHRFADQTGCEIGIFREKINICHLWRDPAYPTVVVKGLDAFDRF